MAERPEDLNLPQSVIGRIMKDAIPDGVSVSKEARNAVSKAASVFVLYATSCANNQALQAKRKTLSANDVLQALRDMEFEEFIEPLQECLEEFRKEQRTKKEAHEQRKKTKDSGDSSGGKDTSGGEDEKNEEDEEDDDDDDDDVDEEEEGDDGWVEETEEAETKAETTKGENAADAESTVKENMEEGS